MTSINRYDDNYDALPDHLISNPHLQTQNEQDDDDNATAVNGNDDENEDEMTSVEMKESDRATTRVLREMHCLSGWFNPIANEVID